MEHEEQFTRFAQLWNDCLSTENILPYTPTGQQAQDSRFSTLRTLMNMILFSLDKIESQLPSPPASQPRTQCKTCPVLRDELIRREEELIRVQDECTNLKRQLHPEPEPPENNENLENENLEEKVALDVDMEDPEILPGTPPPPHPRPRIRIPLSPIKRFHDADRNKIKKVKPTTNTNLTSRSDSTSTVARIKEKEKGWLSCAGIEEIVDDVDVLAKEPQKTGGQGRGGKKLFHQSTLPRSFSVAKNRVSVKTVDLTTLQGYDGGQRSSIPFSGNKASSVKKSRTLQGNMDTFGFLMPSDNFRLMRAEKEQMIQHKDEFVDTETTTDPEETMFNPSASTSTATKSLNSNVCTTNRREFGEATLEMLQNFDKCGLYSFFKLFLEMYRIFDHPNSTEHSYSVKPEPNITYFMVETEYSVFGRPPYNSFRLPNAEPSSPGFAYKPEKAIRKKDERAKLQGWDCDMCREYYTALQSQMSEERIQELKNKCSRHRSKYPVNLDGTPPNFWDMDFPSTAECIEKGFMGEGQPSPSFLDI